MVYPSPMKGKYIYQGIKPSVVTLPEASEEIIDYVKNLPVSKPEKQRSVSQTRSDIADHKINIDNEGLKDDAKTKIIYTPNDDQRESRDLTNIKPLNKKRPELKKLGLDFNKDVKIFPVEFKPSLTQLKTPKANR